MEKIKSQLQTLVLPIFIILISLSTIISLLNDIEFFELRLIEILNLFVSIIIVFLGFYLSNLVSKKNRYIDAIILTLDRIIVEVAANLYMSVGQLSHEIQKQKYTIAIRNISNRIDIISKGKTVFLCNESIEDIKKYFIEIRTKGDILIETENDPMEQQKKLFDSSLDIFIEKLESFKVELLEPR